MPRVFTGFVRFVDAVNYRVGRVAMYIIFVMMAILLWSSISKTFFLPSLWTLEMAQFSMVAYYILGGPYSMQNTKIDDDSHVRMDLFYGGWSPVQKAWMDALTVPFLLFFLGVLLHGGLESSAYSLGYFGKEPYGFFLELVGAFFTGGPDAVQEVTGHLERTPTAWRPYMWPIKLTTCFGILLMILQSLSELTKDIARIRGVEL